MKRKFAAFDIDGTLIRWQLYHAVVNKLAKNGELGDELYSQLKIERQRWKDRENQDSFGDYEKIMLAKFMENRSQVDQARFIEISREIAGEYIDQTYVYTRDLLRKLQNDGYFTMIISGSPIEVLESVAKKYGFDDFLGFDNARLMSPVHTKGLALKSLVSQHDLTCAGSYAVGDSFSDIKMLELAENPIAFNPEKRLYEAAKTNHWPIVVERKNVAFELRWNDGKYELQ